MRERARKKERGGRKEKERDGGEEEIRARDHSELRQRLRLHSTDGISSMPRSKEGRHEGRILGIPRRKASDWSEQDSYSIRQSMFLYEIITLLMRNTTL